MAKTDLEKKLIKLHAALLNRDISIDEIGKYKSDFDSYYYYARDTMINHHSPNTALDLKAIEAFLMLCLDYYTLSSDGDVLINDSEYDEIMTLYMSVFDKPMIYMVDLTDDNVSSWEFLPHKYPGMVGTVRKVYDIADLIDFINAEAQTDYRPSTVILAPKLDGKSVEITFKDGSPTVALTRNDGFQGQNIIAAVRQASNFDDIVSKARRIITTGNGSVKCEIVCSTAKFNELKKVANYKNRRSASTGATSSPSRVKFAKYLNVEPLLYRIDYPTRVEYVYEPLDSIKIEICDPALEQTVENLMQKYRSGDYPYRVDGVVCYVIEDNNRNYNVDAMSSAMAYKINTKFGITKARYGYISIGRTGIATPMIKVTPCDVNETEVEDVSLSNMAKADRFDLREGDTIAIESSGDVIPMLKEVVKRNKHGDRIDYGRKCPHCGSKLKNVSDKLIACVNKNCPRIVVGTVANFFEKVGAKGISDDTLTPIMAKYKLYSVIDVLSITKDMLVVMDGWGETSANNFISIIESVISKPITEATFVGALGISGVSVKRAQIILSEYPLKKILRYASEGNAEFITSDIMNVKGIGYDLANSFADYIAENYEEVCDLMDKLNIISFKPSLGEFVFTGFRSPEMEEDLKELGYDVSSNVNKSTLAVVCRSPEIETSGKIKTAIKNGIPIISIIELSDFIRGTSSDIGDMILDRKERLGRE